MHPTERLRRAHRDLSLTRARPSSYLLMSEAHPLVPSDAVVAVYPHHAAADAAVKLLIAEGFPVRQLSVTGKGFQSDETVVGFYNASDRVKFWGARGAFWGGLWGLFFGGLFLTIPVVGHIVVLGYLAEVAIAAVEGAGAIGGLSALSAALHSLGIPRDSIVQYESAVKADGFLVMVHGPAAEMARARQVLGTAAPSSLVHHPIAATPAL